jgi:hypothetical protein
MGLMEMDQDGHDLTDTQAPISLPLDRSRRQQLILPDRYKRLTKVVDITK